MTGTMGLRAAAEAVHDATKDEGRQTFPYTPAVRDALQGFHDTLLHDDRAGHGPATVLGEMIAAGEVGAAEQFCESCVKYWESAYPYDLDRAQVERQVWGGKRDVLRCVRRNLLR